MIRVDRAEVDEPASLGAPRPSDGTTELQRVIKHRAGPDREKAFDFAVYKTTAVKSALDQLFHGKCAYCESHYAKTQPVDVEHYRPKGEVEEVLGHPGYWWLAMVWTNLLPSCIDCNRRRNQATPNAAAPSLVSLFDQGDVNRWKKLSTGKASSFPLTQGSFRAADDTDDYETEQRLLLDPTRDDPAEHLGFYVDRGNLVSLVFPLPITEHVAPLLPRVATAAEVASHAAAQGVSAMGAVSIQVYGLNRMALVQARSRMLRDLEFMLELALGLAEIGIEIDERIEQRKADAAVNISWLPAVVGELAFLERVKAKVLAHGNLIRAQLKGMIRPDAPYSALARSWVKAYVGEIEQ